MEHLILYSTCMKPPKSSSLIKNHKKKMIMEPGVVHVYRGWWCKNRIKSLISNGHWQKGRKRNRQNYVKLWFFNIIYQKSISLLLHNFFYHNLHVSCVNNLSTSLTLRKNSVRLSFISWRQYRIFAPFLKTI